MVARRYLGFDEVAASLGCDLRVVRRLVLEDKSLLAVRFAINGEQVKFEYGDVSAVDDVTDDGVIMEARYSLFRGKKRLMRRVQCGYLRVPQEEVDRFVKDHGAPARTRARKEAVSDANQLGRLERNTLLKLVIAMAIEGYKYDPKAARNTAPAEIATDTEKLGIGVTDDTVRSWLKKAAEEVLDGAPVLKR